MHYNFHVLVSEIRGFNKYQIAINQIIVPDVAAYCLLITDDNQDTAIINIVDRPTWGIWQH